MLLKPGEVFADHQIEAYLGRGSSAEVYRASAIGGDPAALKVIIPTVNDSAVGAERFRRECEIAETLHHPNVVRAYDHGSSRHFGVVRFPVLLWASMELVSGGTAARLVPAPTEPPHLARTVEVLRQAAAGLDHVHRMDVLHRDVKPANLLLHAGEPLRVALGDFGLAQFFDEAGPLARNGRVQGSLPYASPEVLMAHRLGPAADLYSLACTAVELLTGAPPYPRPTTFAVAHAHISARPPRLSAGRPTLPLALDAVIAHGLAKDPADRPTSCGAFVDEIASALDLYAEVRTP